MICRKMKRIQLTDQRQSDAALSDAAIGICIGGSTA